MTDRKPTNYLEDIGIWPVGANSNRSYVVGFVVSLLLTFIAYSVAVGQASMSAFAIVALLVLAFAQFVTQLVCFLHLGTELKSRERLLTLLCMAVVVLILVIGSLWIMVMLNTRQMLDPAQMLRYMDSQSGL